VLVGSLVGVCSFVGSHPTTGCNGREAGVSAALRAPGGYGAL